MYCVYGESGSSLLLFITIVMIDKFYLISMLLYTTFTFRTVCWNRSKTRSHMHVHLHKPNGRVPSVYKKGRTVYICARSVIMIIIIAHRNGVYNYD